MAASFCCWCHAAIALQRRRWPNFQSACEHAVPQYQASRQVLRRGEDGKRKVEESQPGLVNNTQSWHISSVQTRL